MHFRINFILFIYFSSSIFSTINENGRQDEDISSEVIREALILVKNDHLLSSESELGKRKQEQNMATCTGTGATEIKEFHFVYNKSKYLFKEYAPQIFVQLRTTFGIKPARYFNSLTNEALKGFVNPGEGGSTFLRSSDEQFFLKSLVLQVKEHEILMKNLSAYAEYMTENGNSFLTKYCGIYSIQAIKILAKRTVRILRIHKKKIGSANILWFFSQPNLLKPLLRSDEPASRIDYRFDLKGVQGATRILVNTELPVNERCHREWEFNGPGNMSAFFPDGIICDEKVYKFVAQNLARDAKFLTDKFKVNDYSLFVGIHFNDANEEKEASELMNNSENNSADQIVRMSNGGIGGMYCKGCKLPAGLSPNQGNKGKYSITIFIGIIDLLARFDLRRRLKMILKVHVAKKCPETEQSKVGLSKYEGRFKCYAMDQIFHVENNEKRELYKNEYCHDFMTADWKLSIDEENVFGGRIDRSGKVPKIVFRNQTVQYKKLFGL